MCTEQGKVQAAIKYTPSSVVLCLKVTEEEKVKKKERPAAPDVYLGENLLGGVKENRMDNGMSPIPVGSLECDKSPVYNHDKRGGREGEGEPVKIEGDFPGNFARERANWMCAHHGITTRFERVGGPVCELRQGNSRYEAPRI